MRFDDRGFQTRIVRLHHTPSNPNIFFKPFRSFLIIPAEILFFIDDVSVSLAGRKPTMPFLQWSLRTMFPWESICHDYIGGTVQKITGLNIPHEIHRVFLDKLEGFLREFFPFYLRFRYFRRPTLGRSIPLTFSA